MNSIPAIWPLPLGILVGLACGGIVVRWLALFLASIGKFFPKESPAIRGRSIAPILLSTLFHPVPWLIVVGIPYGLIRLVEAPPSAEWLWFLGGVALYFPIVGLNVLLALRRSRRTHPRRASS